MRRRKTRNINTLQIVQAPLTLVGATNAYSLVESVYSFNGLLGATGNWGAAKAKEIVIHGIDCYSDGIEQSGGTNGNPIVFSEYCYIDALLPSGGTAHSFANFTNENEWSAVTNPNTLPDRIQWRRQCILDGGLGFVVSSSNTWQPVHSRLKRRVNQSDALVFRWESFCVGTGVGIEITNLSIIRYEIVE